MRPRDDRATRRIESTRAARGSARRDARRARPPRLDANALATLARCARSRARRVKARFDARFAVDERDVDGVVREVFPGPLLAWPPKEGVDVERARAEVRRGEVDARAALEAWTRRTGGRAWDGTEPSRDERDW